jgi:hypothetical protein
VFKIEEKGPEAKKDDPGSGESVCAERMRREDALKPWRRIGP